MITGTVNARREAVIPLRVRGPGGDEAAVDAVVDTGSTAALTLPAGTVATLGLAWESGGRAVLADGSLVEFDVYAAEVDWDGRWRRVLVSAVGGGALIGTRLLAGHEFWVEVVPGGAVEVRPLP